MSPHNEDNDLSLPAIEPSADFVGRVTDRVAELEAIRRRSRAQEHQVAACVWACLLGGALLGWALTAPLLPPLWAAYYTVQCFAATLASLQIAWWLPLAAVGIIGVVELTLLAAAQLRKVPALLRGTQA